MYHFLPPASNVDPKGGLSYFIFDLPDEVSRHGERVNSQHEGRFKNIDQTHLRTLFDEIRMLNPCAGELRIAGIEFSQGRPVRPCS